MRSVNIFDPGMQSYAGHHADINLRVAREFKGSGWNVSIYAHRDCSVDSSDVDIHKVFAINPYAVNGSYHLGVNGIGCRSIFSVCVESIQKQLEIAPKKDLSLFPTLFPCQAAAVGLVGKNLGCVVGVIHNAPSWQNKFGEVFWRQGLRAFASLSGERTLGVLEGELLPEYGRILETNSLNIRQFPIPHDGAKRFGKDQSTFTVGILGHQRETKGVSRLPVLVQQLRNAGFSVLVQDSSGRVKSSNDSQVQVMAYVDDFSTVISLCDVVLLDYDLEMYSHNGSGVCWECIASGVPVIVPVGTTMSRLLDRLGLGLFFLSGDMDSLLSQVHKAKNERIEIIRKADQARNKFKATNSTSLFVRAITEAFAK